MERDPPRDTLFIRERKHTIAFVERDGRESHNLFLPGNSIEVAECEVTLCETRIPSNAMKQLVKRLHGSEQEESRSFLLMKEHAQFLAAALRERRVESQCVVGSLGPVRRIVEHEERLRH